MSNFAACLGEKCKGEDQAGIEGAMATMFAKKMIDSKELERSVGCTVSSGTGSLTTGRFAATTAASLAALSQASHGRKSLTFHEGGSIRFMCGTEESS